MIEHNLVDRYCSHGGRGGAHGVEQNVLQAFVMMQRSSCMCHHLAPPHSIVPTAYLNYKHPAHMHAKPANLQGHICTLVLLVIRSPLLSSSASPMH